MADEPHGDEDAERGTQGHEFFWRRRNNGQQQIACRCGDGCPYVPLTKFKPEPREQEILRTLILAMLKRSTSSRVAFVLAQGSAERPEFLTAEETAELLSIPESFVHTLAQRGQLAGAVMVGRLLRVRRAALMVDPERED